MHERTFGSLFAGIGGIDLGLERAGWTGRWQVEWDAYCQRVLAKHWPDIPRYGDITTVDWSGVEPVDLIAGGFPCQPFSVAGRRKGIEDDRWLWPEFARAVGALRPSFVLVENVPGLLAGGGMGSVLGGLAELGYDAQWDSIPAAAVGAPHLRYRVWIVAHRQGHAPRPDADRIRSHRAPFDIFRDFELRHEQVSELGSVGQAGDVADPEGAGTRLEGGDPSVSGRRTTEGWREGVRQGEGRPQDVGTVSGGGGSALADANSSGPQGRPVQPERAGQRAVGEGRLADADSLGRGRQRGEVELDPEHARDGSSRPGREAAGGDPWWRTEPDVGRVAHGVPSRVDRLRSLGNAVVPQVVEVIGRRLMDIIESETA